MSEANPGAAGASAALVRFEQEFMRALFHRKVVERPDVKRALFLAAHADDVEIGCGGTLLKLLDAQIAARVVVLTDGRAAAPTPAQEEEMARVRAEEARSVAAHLCLPPPDLFGVNERELGRPEHAAPLVARLAKILDEFRPDGIFVPWFFDQHPDHRTCNELLARALERRADLKEITVFAYEVWSLVPPLLVVDVSSVLAEKKRLVSLYRSQLPLFPYLEFVDELARLRAPLAGARATAVELFRPMRGDEHVVRMTALDLASPDVRAINVLLTPLS